MTVDEVLELKAGEPSEEDPCTAGAGGPGQLAKVAAVAGLVGILIGGLGFAAILRDPQTVPVDRDRITELADELAVTRDALTQATADFEALRGDTITVLNQTRDLLLSCSAEAAADTPSAACAALVDHLDALLAP